MIKADSARALTQLSEMTFVEKFQNNNEQLLNKVHDAILKNADIRKYSCNFEIEDLDSQTRIELIEYLELCGYSTHSPYPPNNIVIYWNEPEPKVEELIEAIARSVV